MIKRKLNNLIKELIFFNKKPSLTEACLCNKIQWAESEK